MLSFIKTLPRYIGKKFFINTLATFAVFSLLIFMIDFIELLRQAGKYGSVPAYILVWLTLLRLPAYTEFLLAFAVLVGGISTLLQLNRSSELAVMRAGGMSVWQFLKPSMIVATLLGVFFVTVFNPVAASARAEAERLYAEVFGRDVNVFRTSNSGSWLRQNGRDGETIITAAHASNNGLTLTKVTAFEYDRTGKFTERIDATTANLQEGVWILKDAWVTSAGTRPEKYREYLVSTYLTPERVRDALGTVISLSFWDLPALIEVAEKANLSSARLRIQYGLLLSRPFLCIAMVLLAATVSLKSFRSGGIQTMIITGLIGGLGFFLLAEVSRQVGVAGLVPPWAAVWLPIVMVIFISLTVLLHQEDG